MKKRNFHTTLWSVIGAAAIVLLVWQTFFPFEEQIKSFQERAGELITEKLNQHIATPEPLRGPMEARDVVLTRLGVIEHTNAQRTENGLSTLEESQALSASAALKVQDMFENQYFAHDSPSGDGVGELANSVGYEYIFVGENLALGNFEDDAALVEAWMNSPGHRENILNSGYTEIGIGVAKGIFDGQEVWLAVQHFGKPQAACPQPDTELAAQIEAAKDQLRAWEIELQERREDIDSTPQGSPQYNRKVREYNALVEQYNSLAQETRSMVNNYNEQVHAFNACAAQ